MSLANKIHVNPVPKFYTLLKVVPLSLKYKFHVNLVEAFCKIDEKLAFGLILALLGAKKGPKICTQGPFFTHIWKYPQYACNQVSWSDIKNFLSKRPKTTKNPYFL